MRLKAFKRMGDPNPIVQEVSVVLIEQDDGTAISIACDLNGMIHVSHCMDPEFNRVLQTLGFEHLTVCENIADSTKLIKDSVDKLNQLPGIIG